MSIKYFYFNLNRYFYFYLNRFKLHTCNNIISYSSSASINKAPKILITETVRFDKSASLRCHRSHLEAFYQSMQFDEKNDSTRRAAKYTAIDCDRRDRALATCIYGGVYLLDK